MQHNHLLQLNLTIARCVLGFETQLDLWHAKLTEEHVLQHQVIDVEAMLVALLACLVPALPRLNRHKPAFHLFTLPAAAVIAMAAAVLLILDVSYMAFLVTRPWFDGGTGNAYLVSAGISCPRFLPRPKNSFYLYHFTFLQLLQMQLLMT